MHTTVFAAELGRGIVGPSGVQLLWWCFIQFSLLYQEITSSCFCSNCGIAIRSAKLLGSSIYHCPSMVCMVSSIACANHFLVPSLHLAGQLCFLATPVNISKDLSLISLWYFFWGSVHAVMRAHAVCQSSGI